MSKRSLPSPHSAQQGPEHGGTKQQKMSTNAGTPGRGTTTPTQATQPATSSSSSTAKTSGKRSSGGGHVSATVQQRRTFWFQHGCPLLAQLAARHAADPARELLDHNSRTEGGGTLHVALHKAPVKEMWDELIKKEDQVISFASYYPRVRNAIVWLMERLYRRLLASGKDNDLKPLERLTNEELMGIPEDLRDAAVGLHRLALNCLHALLHPQKDHTELKVHGQESQTPSTTGTAASASPSVSSSSIPSSSSSTATSSSQPSSSLDASSSSSTTSESAMEIENENEAETEPVQSLPPPQSPSRPLQRHKTQVWDSSSPWASTATYQGLPNQPRSPMMQMGLSQQQSQQSQLPHQSLQPVAPMPVHMLQQSLQPHLGYLHQQPQAGQTSQEASRDQMPAAGHSGAGLQQTQALPAQELHRINEQLAQMHLRVQNIEQIVMSGRLQQPQSMVGGDGTAFQTPEQLLLAHQEAQLENPHQQRLLALSEDAGRRFLAEIGEQQQLVGQRAAAAAAASTQQQLAVVTDPIGERLVQESADRVIEALRPVLRANAVLLLRTPSAGWSKLSPFWLHPALPVTKP